MKLPTAFLFDIPLMFSVLQFISLMSYTFFNNPVPSKMKMYLRKVLIDILKTPKHLINYFSGIFTLSAKCHVITFSTYYQVAGTDEQCLSDVTRVIGQCHIPPKSINGIFVKMHVMCVWYIKTHLF